MLLLGVLTTDFADFHGFLVVFVFGWFGVDGNWSGLATNGTSRWLSGFTNGVLSYVNHACLPVRLGFSRNFSIVSSDGLWWMV
jgi:hypothetical protein